MAQAIGDPEEIRSFSNTLEHYLNTVEEETGRLNSAFEQLGSLGRISREQVLKKLISS